MLRSARTGKPVDPDWLSFATLEISDYEAEEILQRQKDRERANAYQEKLRAADTRPMCSEGYSYTWHGRLRYWRCGSHATTTYQGKPCCKIHAAMYERRDARKAAVVICSEMTAHRIPGSIVGVHCEDPATTHYRGHPMCALHARMHEEFDKHRAS